jgi:hypothetical protein
MFTDRKGRTWDLSLNLGIAREIDASSFKGYYEPTFSFIKPEKQVFSAMISDQKFMWAVIWALVQRQARQKFREGSFLFGPYSDPDPTQVRPTTPSETDEAFKTHYDAAELEFVEGLDGKAMTEGRKAFWRSLSDFFPDQATVLSLLERQYDRLRMKVNESVTEMEQDMETSLDEALEKDKLTLRGKFKKLVEERSAN